MTKTKSAIVLGLATACLWTPSLFISSRALASGMGSAGGGEFRNDQENPWFLKNATTVKYCVVVAPQGFSASQDRIEALIPQAIQYWQNEFANESILGIAKQNFIKQPDCSGVHQLQFQFGYETLSTSQINGDFLQRGSDPQDFVAIAVRDGYDATAMSGNGYVFFGSDRGDHPYNKGQGVATNLWQHDGVLYRVLVHELGHVFGVVHTPGEPMGEDYPERVLQHYSDYRDIGELAAFFRPKTAYQTCVSATQPAAWPFPTPPNTQCVNIAFLNDFRSVQVSAVSASGAITPIGSAVSRQSTARILGFPVKVFFPTGVAPAEIGDLGGQKVLNGPSRQSITAYFNLPKELGSLNVMVDLEPSSLRINGVIGQGDIDPLLQIGQRGVSSNKR